jgi:hypothetical protein
MDDRDNDSDDIYQDENKCSTTKHAIKKKTVR